MNKYTGTTREKEQQLSFNLCWLHSKKVNHFNQYFAIFSHIISCANMGSTVIFLLEEVDNESVLYLRQKAHTSWIIKHWLHASKDDKSHLFLEFLTFFCSILEHLCLLMTMRVTDTNNQRLLMSSRCQRPWTHRSRWFSQVVEMQESALWTQRAGGGSAHHGFLLASSSLWKLERFRPVAWEIWISQELLPEARFYTIC